MNALPVVAVRMVVRRIHTLIVLSVEHLSPTTGLLGVELPGLVERHDGRSCRMSGLA